MSDASNLVDWDEMREGFTFSGKSKSIYEWRLQKDDAAFDKLCTRLQRNKCHRRWYQRNKARTAQRVKNWRHRRHRREGRVAVCVICQAEWCAVPWRRDSPRKYCGGECFKRSRRVQP